MAEVKDIIQKYNQLSSAQRKDVKEEYRKSIQLLHPEVFYGPRIFDWHYKAPHKRSKAEWAIMCIIIEEIFNHKKSLTI